MLSTLFRKRLTDEQLATVFVNGVLDVTGNGFKEVVELIKYDAAFVTTPHLDETKDGHFIMIVIVGNLSKLDEVFEADEVGKLEEAIIERFSDAFQMTKVEFKRYLSEYRSFMSRVNHPSKNMHYAMSKAFFHKYGLNEYQDEYFKEMVNPNPLFLKRMDEVMESFFWNWEAFFKRFKIA